MTTPAASRLDELLLHAAWARRLARSLVGESAAEDLVQDAWAAALRRPPRAGSPVRPWLATVLRNGARQRLRGMARRRAREERASRDEALPSAAELTARTESQRLLFEALLGLEPEARKLVLLRFVDELPVAEIARREGLAASTVRDRLERALDTLRSSLTKCRGDWVRALAPLCVRVPRLSPVAATAGLLMMKTKLAPLLLAALLLSVASLVYMQLEPGGEAPAMELAGAGSAVPLEVSVGTAAETRGSGASREAIAGAAEAVSTPALDSAMGLETANLRLRFVDERGAPVSGVVLEGGPPRADAATGSDSAGVLTARFPSSSRVFEASVTWRHPDFASDSVRVRLEAGRELDRGEIVLRAGGAIRGWLVDEAQQPLAGLDVWVPGARLRLADSGGGFIYRNSALGSARDISAEDGSFFLGGLLVGSAQLSIESRDHVYSCESRPIDVRPGEVTEDVWITVARVPDSGLIAGVVLDPAGEPVQRATITASWHETTFANEGRISNESSGSTQTRTDAAGRFTLVAQAAVAHDLEVWSPGLPRWPAVFASAVEPGAVGLELRFEEPTYFELLVRGADGEPVSGGRVEHIESQKSPAYVRLDSSGRAHIPIVERPVTLSLVVPGHRIERVGPLAPGELHDRKEPLEVRLRAAPGVRGVVRSAAGPLAGVEVCLLRVTEGGELQVGAPTWSDEAGEFLLELREPGSFCLRATAEGLAPAEFGLQIVDPAVGLSGVVLELAAGGSIHGRLLATRAADAAGRLVVAFRGDGWPAHTYTDGVGDFQFDGLIPGAWQVQLAAQPPALLPRRWSQKGALGSPSACTVFEGAVAEVELRIADAAPASLSGQLRFAGVELEGWTARLEPWVLPEGARGFESPPGLLDAAGRFTLRAAVAGGYDLVIGGPGAVDLGLRFPIKLSPGANEWQAELESATLRVIAGDEPREVVYMSRRKGGMSALFGALRVEAGAALELFPVPSGKARLSFALPDSRLDGARELELEAGEVRVVKLP